MSEAVLADAQFSVARIFRPFEGFETVYDNQPSRRPIMVPGTLDPDAGQPGFRDNLVAGIPVPMGSKVMLWIPTIFLNAGGDPPDLLIVPYRYQFIWRLRNLKDFQNRRAAYHFPRQSPGAGGNTIVPAAQRVLTFEGAETVFNSNTTPSASMFSQETFTTSRAVLERLELVSQTPLPPFLPSGATDAAYQQGIATFTGVDLEETVTFNAIQMDAEGDELLIAIDRLGPEGNFTSDPNWDFSNPNGIDFGLSLFFGSGSGSVLRDLGIYVFTGSNP